VAKGQPPAYPLSGFRNPQSDFQFVPACDGLIIWTKQMSGRKATKQKPARKQPKSVTPRFLDVKIQNLILVVLGLVFYANTFTNLYAFDDAIVIQKNTYVQEGLRGIPRIFASDVYESFYAQMGAEQQLSGGRYRPLSVATFALEQQLFGSKEMVKPADDVAPIRHFVNVFLYILSVVFLLHLLRKHILPESPYAAFLACVIFLAHPLHTEVVANVKSRDEILSFLFIILTFIAVCRYRETRRTSQLAFGLFFYFLALLSKEYAVTLIALLPLFLFVVKKETLANSLKAVLPFLAVTLLYLGLRYAIVGLGSTEENQDVLNNPYKFATHPEQWATKIAILARYLTLLFYPHPLSSDYSYNAIPYTHFNDPRVWLSLVLYASMIAVTIVLFIRRNVLAFASAFYLAHLFLVSNFVIEIGATMGERLIYHSSFGFALGIAILCGWAIQKVESEKRKTLLTIAVSVGLIIPCGAIVIPRNAQWKNDTSLFLADVETVPNSVLVNGNAARAYLTLSERPENKAIAIELTKKSIPFLTKAISIHKRYLNGYLDLGVVYGKLGELEKAEECWNTAQEIYPDHPYVKANFHLLALTYHRKAMDLISQDTPEAIRLLERATRVDPGNADLWYDLGEACFRMKEFAKARAAWVKTLQLKPDYKEAEQKMSALPQQ
jgi:protein O-mannosyl-transferase